MSSCVKWSSPVNRSGARELRTHSLTAGKRMTANLPAGFHAGGALTLAAGDGLLAAELADQLADDLRPVFVEDQRDAHQ